MMASTSLSSTSPSTPSTVMDANLNRIARLDPATSPRLTLLQSIHPHRLVSFFSVAAEGIRKLLDQPSTPPFPHRLLVSGMTDKRGRIGKAATSAAEVVPRNQVMNRVKDFLGGISKANDKMELDIHERSRADYDVEVLSGNEKTSIEMDLLLGVADPHDDEAVAAAEAALSGVTPPSLPFASDRNYSDTSDESSDEKEASRGSEKKRKQNKRPKIVVLDPSSNQSRVELDANVSSYAALNGEADQPEHIHALPKGCAIWMQPDQPQGFE